MISEELKAYAQKFCELGNNMLSETAPFVFDYSWLSLGLAELFTFDLRKKKALAADERTFVRGLAAYIGALAYASWQRFCSDVIAHVDQEKGVFIEGKLPSGERLRVDIEEKLLFVLSELPNPFPVIGDFSRHLLSRDGIISSFALGVMTGFSPFGEGACLTRKLEDSSGSIDEVVKVLAQGCAYSYSQAFPEEPLGQVAELYLHALVYPPLMMHEGLPACEAVGGLFEFRRHFKVGEKNMLQLTENLLQCPDEQISSAAFAYYGAVCEQPSASALVYRDMQNGRTGLLRAAMLNVRETMGKGGDWLLNEELSEEDKARFRIEKQLGFLPWVKIREKTLTRVKEEPRILALLIALAEYDANGAKGIADAIAEDHPNEIDVRLQRIFLDCVYGDVVSAALSCRALITEPEAEEDYAVYALWGKVELLIDEVDSSISHLQKALDLCDEPGEAVVDINRDLATAFLKKKDYVQTDAALRAALRAAPFPLLLPLLERSYVAKQQGRAKEASEILKEAIKIAPYDRRVVRSFLDEVVEQG